jgi:hypothetical protein
MPKKLTIDDCIAAAQLNEGECLSTKYVRYKIDKTMGKNNE